jgi:hypothetical protein
MGPAVSTGGKGHPPTCVRQRIIHRLIGAHHGKVWLTYLPLPLQIGTLQFEFGQRPGLVALQTHILPPPATAEAMQAARSASIRYRAVPRADDGNGA